MATCRVLLVEDEITDIRRIRRLLGKATISFEVIAVSTLAEGVAAIGQEQWDIVLSDLTLPDSRGLHTVQAIRKTVPPLPIVVLTGCSEGELALKALEEGAQDYLEKQTLSTENLERAIRYAIQRQKNAEMNRFIKQIRARDRLLARKNRHLRHLYNTAHQFVDNVSHEFRTPLTVVKEYVSLLRDELVGSVADGQKHLLDIVADRADDLNTMVDDMLDISRLEAGMLCAYRESCALEEIVAHTRPSLEKKSLVKNLHLEFDVPAALPPIFCDKEKAGRVLINLAVNAMRSCGESGVVRIWANDLPEQRAVEVHVTDNGAGIDDDQLNTIFLRFRQLNDDFRDTHRGFGLGLNIASNLVALNLGEVDVTSKIGVGSTFSFTIPYFDPVEVARRYCRRLDQVSSEATVVSLIEVHSVGDTQTVSRDALQRFMYSTIRYNNLLLPLTRCRWLVLLPVGGDELEGFIKRINNAKKEFDHNRPAGPTPDIRLQTMGTWHVETHTEVLLTRIRESCDLAEHCCD